MRYLLALVASLVVTTATAQPTVERGRYLVETIAACGNCHTPKGPDAPPNRTLAGGHVLIDAPPFTAIPSNITPDRETGIGAWTDEQIILAIREGKRPDGSLIGPPMPIPLYRQLADEDVKAMVAYLRTVPPIRNAVAKSTYRIKLPPSYGPPVSGVKAPSRSDRLAHGAYLAGPVGHCIECHTPMEPNGPGMDMKRLGAGGRVFPLPAGSVVAANITSSKTSGLGKWTDAQLERAIRAGVSADGHPLFPLMGFSYYKGINAEDMAALIAYIRSLPPID